MSLRPRRALLGLVTAVAALAALPATLPATASAAETLSVSPSSTAAGSNPTITDTLGFAPGPTDTPQTVVLSTAPGLLENLNANPSCLASQQLTAGCLIGSATVDTSTPGGNLTGNLYLVPAAPGSGDMAGIELVAAGPLANQYIGVSLNSASPGGLNLTTTFPDTTLQVTGFTAVLNPTLNGQPFTRLPSSCSTATSNLSVTYYGPTPAGAASGAFTPTGCPGAQPYAPTLTAAITASKGNAALTLRITQAADEAASKTISVAFPSGLTPNIGSLLPCVTGGTGCTIGTATATSPLAPTPLKGTVTLGGSLASPTFAIKFPPPFNLVISGVISLTHRSVTFSNVPDVPITNLTLAVTGPNGKAAFTTDCQPATVTGSFTGQGGQTHTSPAPIQFTGCQQVPVASGSVAGLAAGHPDLKLKVAHRKGAPGLSVVALGLPAGLKFSHSAIVTHEVCTTQGKKKKCTTTTLIKGLGVAGAQAKSVTLKAGRLVITLTKPSARVSLTVVGPLLSETKSLQAKVRKHKAASLSFTLKVTDAKHTSSTITQTLKA